MRKHRPTTNESLLKDEHLRALRTNTLLSARALADLEVERQRKALRRALIKVMSKADSPSIAPAADASSSPHDMDQHGEHHGTAD